MYADRVRRGNPRKNVLPHLGWCSALVISLRRTARRNLSRGHVDSVECRAALVPGQGCTREALVGNDVGAANPHIAAERLRKFVREGYAADAHHLGRYTVHRRRARCNLASSDLLIQPRRAL
jgi:hypothetical protein